MFHVRKHKLQDVVYKFQHVVHIFQELEYKNRNEKETIVDDSNIDSGLRLSRYKYICAQRFIDKIKKIKNIHLNPIEISNKYRTKSFSAKQDYVSTILGFLERSHSSLSLNSNGK